MQAEIQLRWVSHNNKYASELMRGQKNYIVLCIATYSTYEVVLPTFVMRNHDSCNNNNILFY